MTLFNGRVGHAACATLVALLVAAPAPVFAQQASAPFVVAVPDVYPAKEGHGFIVRSGDARQQDVIVLNHESLDASRLVAAVALLRQLRLRPVPAGATEVTTVQGMAAWQGRRTRAVPALDRALASLRAAPRTRIGNAGTGRWLRLPGDVLR